MKDRISLYPGRVELTPVPGQTNVYDMTRADEPQEVGTPLNKATLLKDDVAMLLGLDTENATPNDVFEILLNEITTIRNTSVKVVYGTYTGNGTTSKTINFGFSPKIVFLGEQIKNSFGETFASETWTMAINGIPKFYSTPMVNIGNYDGRDLTFTWSATSLKITCSDVYYGLNRSGATIHYVAIG